MSFKEIENMPIYWSDHEDIAMALFERFGTEYSVKEKNVQKPI